MKNEDDALRADLVAATERDLPGEEFVDRVMETIEEGGGERVLSAAAPAPRLRRVVGLAAAAIVLGVGVWAATTGRLLQEPAAGAAAAGAAADGVELPPARTGVAGIEPIRITVTKDVEISMDGRRGLSLDQLRSLLFAAVGALAPGECSERDVILRIDRGVRWREVQWVMQACADPDIRLYRLHFAVAGEDGAALLPVFLPHDRSLAGSRRLIENPKATIVLKRTKSESQTRIVLLDRPVGVGDQGFRSLGDQLAAVFRDTPRTVEVNAWADVPYEEVVRAVDLARTAGAAMVTFVGTAPPK